jgi:heat shock protein HslJ
VSRSVAALAVLAVLLAAGVATACGDDNGEIASLEGTSWVLASGVDLPSDVPVSRPTAGFTSDTISGFGGCNRYTGGYSTDGEALEIGALASTQMACEPPAGTIEAAYLAALEQVGSRTSDGDQLVLSDAAGDELLRFDAAPAS